MALTQEALELIEKDVVAFLIKHDELEAGGSAISFGELRYSRSDYIYF